MLATWYNVGDVSGKSMYLSLPSVGEKGIFLILWQKNVTVLPSLVVVAQSELSMYPGSYYQ